MKLLMLLVTIPIESPDHPESMYEILSTIFFYLCQRKAKSYELPLLASHFYIIMQDCIPGLKDDYGVPRKYIREI